MNQFERGGEVKETLRIGKLWDAAKVESIFISIKDPSIADTRERGYKRKYEPDPRTIIKNRVRGEQAHAMLKILSEKKFPWSIIFKIFPEYEADLKSNEIKLAFFILLDKNSSDKTMASPGYRTLGFREAMGRNLLYEKTLYSIPPGDKRK